MEGGTRIADEYVMTHCCVQVAGAIQGAIAQAKLSVLPIRRGYWGSKIGLPHTVPVKVRTVCWVMKIVVNEAGTDEAMLSPQVTGKCGSIRIRLTPAPRGAGLVASPVPKKILQYSGLEDCYTASTGRTATLGNFAKATYNALIATYKFLTPDLWKKSKFRPTPFQQHTDFLATTKAKKISSE